MSYRLLLADRTLSVLATSTALARLAQVMFDVSVVVFVVNDLHRPGAAGLTVLLATLPGLILSPASGRFLQGRNVTAWMALDCAVKAAATLGIAAAGAAGGTGLGLLLVLAFASSLTGAFGNVALRSYIALALPAERRGPANGLDSVISALAAMVGPAIAGVAVALVGGRRGVAAVGVMYLVAAAVSLAAGRTTPEPAAPAGSRSSVSALGTIVSDPVLRGLTAIYFFFQVAMGVLVVALPTLVATGYRAGPSWVGISWSVAGTVGIASALIAGSRFRPELGPAYLVAGAAVTALGSAALFLHTSIAALLVAFVVLGLAVGPLDVGLLGLRQEALPAGAATATLAVSSSVNMAGYPAGALLGGLIAGLGTTTQTATATACALVSLLAGLVLAAGRRRDLPSGDRLAEPAAPIARSEGTLS